MRILYLNSCGQIGGAETSLLELFKCLRDESGYELTLLLGEDGPLKQLAEAAGVSTVILPFPPELARMGDAGLGSAKSDARHHTRFLTKAMSAGFASLRYIGLLRRAIRECRPDLIHVTGLKMQMLSVLAKSGRAPLIWHIHDYPSSRQLVRRVFPRVSGRCSGAIVNSDSVGRDLRGVCGSRLGITRIFNAVDLTRFHPDGHKLDLDRAAGCEPPEDRAIRVGLVATFGFWKGHEVFMQAMARVPREINIRGYIIGGPIYQTEGSQHSFAGLREAARRLGVEDRIAFTGVLRDPAPAIRSLDILVHASTQPEPFGMTIVEGMACARAVIVSRAGGAMEIISDGVDALTHTPGDAEELADRITRLAEDRPMREAMGRAARMNVELRFSRDRLRRELVEYYSGAVGVGNQRLPVHQESIPLQ